LLALDVETPIMAVDIVTGEMTYASATNFTSVYDGITEDRRHNLYASDSDLGVVYRFDSTLMAERVVISSGHNVPEGIHFNILHSTLAIPNLFGHTIDFLPFDVDLWSTFDTVFGWAPLEVSLSAGSDYDVVEWIWDFGDGDTTFGQSPTHIYEDAGYFDVTLCAVTAGDDTVTRVYPGHMSVLADSLWADDVDVGENGLLEVVISATNNVPLKELRTPVGYSGGMGLVYDSFSTEGCRTEFFISQEEIGLNVADQNVSFRLRTRPDGSPLFLPPGSGPVLKVYFHQDGDPASQEMELSFDPEGAYYSPAFVSDAYTFSPGLHPPSVTIRCCGIHTGGYSGNVDCSDDGKRNLADITQLIDRVYVSKADLCCEANGNTDGDVEDKVNLADITKLIDHVYVSKGETAACQ
jgi:PKD repeat protein